MRSTSSSLRIISQKSRNKGITSRGKPYKGYLRVYLSSSKNSSDGLGDFRSDTVTLDKGYCVVSLQARSTQELPPLISRCVHHGIFVLFQTWVNHSGFPKWRCSDVTLPRSDMQSVGKMGLRTAAFFVPLNSAIFFCSVAYALRNYIFR